MHFCELVARVVVAPLAAEEHVLELVHPRVGEEQRRVVGRDERRAGDDAVAVSREEVEERGADLVRRHNRIIVAGSPALHPSSSGTASSLGARLEGADDEATARSPGGPAAGAGGGSGRGRLSGRRAAAQPAGDGASEERRSSMAPEDLVDRLVGDVGGDADRAQLAAGRGRGRATSRRPRCARRPRPPGGRRRRRSSRRRAMAASMASGSCSLRASRSRSCASDSSRRDSIASAAL